MANETRLTGKLVAARVMHNGAAALLVTVRGNVGVEGRAILDQLGMLPAVDMYNCSERIVSTPEELDALRTALLDAGIVTRNQ